MSWGRGFLVLVVALSAGNAHARVPLLDPAVGFALDRLLDVAGRSSLAPSFQPSPDVPLELRARQALTRVRATRTDWRYGATRLVLIQGTAGEPNAFCTGPSFYVSTELVRQLTDDQLVGVIAHEMAHAEEGHLTQRMSHGFAAILIQFGRLVASDARAIVTGGDADAFMRELWRRGHWEMIQEMLLEAELGQEMQADCFAARWTRHPEHIAEALATLVGLPVQVLADEDPLIGARVRNLLSGGTTNCD
jgi:Zn-dependent protease with chaperone function